MDSESSSADNENVANRKTAEIKSLFICNVNIIYGLKVIPKVRESLTQFRIRVTLFPQS